MTTKAKVSPSFRYGISAPLVRCAALLNVSVVGGM
jgi:hypothetical protein